MRIHSVFIRHVERLRRLLIGMGLSAEDGEDVLQDVYLEALRRPPDYRGREELARWLMRVTINRCLLEFRRKSRNQRAADEIIMQRAGRQNARLEPDSRAIQKEQTDAMRQCLYEMDESIRVPLVLKYYCELNSSEISEILELKPGTVRKRLCNGRVILAEMLLQKGIQP